ncbi:MAG TPA: ATP-binding protein [Candidatus Limnocylindrales bacterium]|nr:ATP-binding protein [Candidatus Limnocylindrales bacterium]
MTEQEAVSGLFAATPLPMFVLDAPVTRVLAANDAALDRYSLSSTAVPGLDPSRLVPPALAASFREWAAAGDGSPTEAFEQRTADGVSFAAELRVTRLRWGGDEGRLLIVRDVSARVRNEERLRQAQKMEAIGRLAGSIAHDFNNLLTAIGGYADLLAQSLDPHDAGVEDAREIRRAVDRGAALTRQLLAFSRRQLVQTQIVDLNESVHGMRPLLERLLGEHVRLTLGLGPAAGSVRIDPGQLEQVLLNLALNGRDAMPDGGRLLVETAQVELDEPYAAARRDVTPGRHAVLAVSDEGRGLSEEARAHLFEPFFTTKARGEGTGLGLATVYGIVRQAGGHIDVFSDPELGTTFRVYLPSVQAEVAITADEEPGEPERADARLRLTGSVLVVEDDPSVRRVVVETLARTGLDVEAAGDGAEALRLLIGGPTPDLVITDVRMPRLSGPELVREARRPWPGLRVLFVSGHTGDDTPDGFLEPGDRLLGKPFSAEALIEAVADLLRPDRSDAAPSGTAPGDRHLQAVPRSV